MNGMLTRDEFVADYIAATGFSTREAIAAWNNIASRHVATQMVVDKVCEEVASIKTELIKHDTRIGEVEKSTAKNTADIAALQNENKDLWWWLKLGALPVGIGVGREVINIVNGINNPTPVPVIVTGNTNGNS